MRIGANFFLFSLSLFFSSLNFTYGTGNCTAQHSFFYFLSLIHLVKGMLARPLQSVMLPALPLINAKMRKKVFWLSYLDNFLQIIFVAESLDCRQGFSSVSLLDPEKSSGEQGSMVPVRNPEVSTLKHWHRSVTVPIPYQIKNVTILQLKFSFFKLRTRKYVKQV